ncbi:MAG TPA: efflux RND transporter periplasmic adaptor subunit [Caulobacteraceae bacterium]|jgi:RND family efflux transporter MFP subunit|nr:efflux RND transporter periplasmic adaptor subunit [Caulobacteraceae bacterium]
MFRRSSIPPAVLAIGAAVGLTACSAKPQADPRTQAPLVQTVAPGAASASDQSFTGVVSARVQSDIGFRVPGKVVERLVDVGQTVRRGQPLMRIDPTDFELTLAGLKAKAVQASADEARYRDLVAAGAVSASTYGQIKANADAAQAQMRVAQDEAGYSVIVADADGVVVQTLAEPGQVVAAGQTVVKLAHAGPREATVDLPETVRPALGSQAVAAVFGATSDAPAKLRQLSDSADPVTRTFEARYVLGAAAAQAPLGATVTISLSSPRAGAGVMVPVGALADRGRAAGVYVVDPRTSSVRFQAVRIVSLGDDTAVVDGALSGATIVSLGANLLHGGEKIRLSGSQVAAR